jgi:hypothetical protein
MLPVEISATLVIAILWFIWSTTKRKREEIREKEEAAAKRLTQKLGHLLEVLDDCVQGCRVHGPREYSIAASIVESALEHCHDAAQSAPQHGLYLKALQLTSSRVELGAELWCEKSLLATIRLDKEARTVEPEYVSLLPKFDSIHALRRRLAWIESKLKECSWFSSSTADWNGMRGDARKRDVFGENLRKQELIFRADESLRNEAEKDIDRLFAKLDDIREEAELLPDCPSLWPEVWEEDAMLPEHRLTVEAERAER